MDNNNDNNEKENDIKIFTIHLEVFIHRIHRKIPLLNHLMRMMVVNHLASTRTTTFRHSNAIKKKEEERNRTKQKHLSEIWLAIESSR